MWFRLPGLRARSVLALLVLVGACKNHPAPPVPPVARAAPPPSQASKPVSPSSASPTMSAQAELPPLEVSKNSALLFTYVESNGKLATTDKPEKVPKVTRRIVRIMGKGNGEPKRRNNSNVEVIDLRELLAKGKTQPRVMSHEAFETVALAQLPPGDSCALAGPHGPPLPEGPETTKSPSGPPIVILYGTRWCGTGTAARQYLVSNLIPFISKDIENDPAAARELQQKCSRFGIKADRVPILDVRGRLTVGFDEGRMDGLLADW